MAGSTAKVEGLSDRRAYGEAAEGTNIPPKKSQVSIAHIYSPISHITSPLSISVIPDFLYRKVIVKGRWDHEHTMLLGPRVWDGTLGYHVITPLVRENGTTILVDRGFISEDFADRNKRPEVDGEVEVLGMLRASQARNNFTPDNHPEKGEWYWADVDAMVQHAGGEAASVQPVFIEELFGRYL